MRPQINYLLGKEYLGLGLTNLHYATINNQIIRISRFKIEPFLDRDNEVQVLSLIKDQAPDFTFKIKDFGWQNEKFCVVTDYICDLRSLLKTGVSRVSVTRLADFVKKFHNLKLNPQKYFIKTFNFRLFYQTIKNQIKDFPFTYNYEAETQILKDIAELGPRPLVLSHNDLSSGNFVFCDNHSWLIDFEYASLNDPLYDVASFISETLTDHKHILLWMQTWNLSREEVIITTKWMRYQNLLNSHWALLMLQLTQQEVFLAIAKNQYDRFLNPYPLQKIMESA